MYSSRHFNECIYIGSEEEIWKIVVFIIYVFWRSCINKCVWPNWSHPSKNLFWRLDQLLHEKNSFIPRNENAGLLKQALCKHKSKLFNILLPALCFVFHRGMLSISLRHLSCWIDIHAVRTSHNSLLFDGFASFTTVFTSLHHKFSHTSPFLPYASYCPVVGPKRHFLPSIWQHNIS